ncbi:class I SAM-dependent methyltransferase [Candidatus Woesearchaeota archaeon]|nr:class I SAM-dependent methyltransferase [Candidatus Woesearchaeota archaeon]
MSEQLYVHKTTCMSCKSTDLTRFISLGLMPEAGSYLKKEDIPDEKKFPLDVYFCNNCKLVQLLDIVDPDYLYKDYRYASSTTSTLRRHFEEYAKNMFERFDLNEHSLIIDVGSNDGVLLLPFMKLGARAIGFEPAENIAKSAVSIGTHTINKFFNEKNSIELAEKEGKAKIITANNTLASIYNTDEVMKGVKALLDEDGVFIFEVHYLLDLINDLQFDQFYHQHMHYYAVMPLKHYFEKHGMQIFDVIRMKTHGGSIRVFAQFKGGPQKIHPRVQELIDLEHEQGLDTFDRYKKFADEVIKLKNELVASLKKLKAGGKKIAGYGAPGKGNTLLNYFGIGTDILDYIIDASPERYNRFIPGMHIPIYPPSKFKEDSPDYALMLAFTYKDEILAKENKYLEKGGKFIIPLPKIEVLPNN